MALHGVSKRFYYYEHRTNSIREWFIRSVLRQPVERREQEAALRNVTFSIRAGEAVALVGGNGSGKSTALRLIAGIYRPSEGRVERRGRIAPVLELGAGFHPELSGGENLRTYATLLGMSRRERLRATGEIVEFAGIADVIDLPIKYYSMGMRARLAFSVATHSEPDVLLLDEVLAVGDQEFQERCQVRIRDFHGRGGTLLLVSHQLDRAREFCSRALWLQAGELVMDDEIDGVLQAYRAAARAPEGTGQA